ncbi:4-alpha-glucanotransferase [Denitrovibrio acetiphilus DSM 12809]|uniref:4-alpha-glucanotransferase n=1 Tax=Denitrovibrio acetiphilus (strain DSM 12809 / NBRC 114555 / N2460) TaxID=522772 RepID=D4H3F1_DENA2|nr:alpha-amylase/4-alpha-glucanotransferase domain-containing protein [Denitrovibrio acetiphilus]ADD67235.1 4-alpha-glucanotransferase [Denitrovibrio acetiphilus DSM 12809]
MKKLPVHLGIHCHQPVENFYHVVDYAVEKSYLPYFEVALTKPDFRFSVHYSGWLLEYIKNNHSKLFSMMKQATDSDQAEFFSGGYYEPVLASIPSKDRREQIRKLNGFIEDNFKVSPKGLWLTERVWDSSIIPDCAEVGIEYVIVDDYHFIAAGFYESMLHTHFKTEQDGHEMLIFPISEKLRYLTPFKPADEVADYLRSVQEAGGKSITIFDDGEKFGLWPETHEWVYEKGWLSDFIDAVTESGHSEFALFKDTVKEQKPAQITYLPTVSYFEMGEWSLFSERTLQMENVIRELEKTHEDDTTKVFVKGGIWKNFLVKYPESNRIHKRTVSLSKKANESGDLQLLDALYKAQCNDVLWHGIFGGLYLPNLRNNAYRFIIEAEKRLEEVSGMKFPSVETGDFDYDGYDEAYIRTQSTNYMFVSRDCGQLTSLEDKDNLFNFLNTLARRKEAYHEKLFAAPEESENIETNDEAIANIHDGKAKVDEEYRKHLVFDWHNKNSFIDHFVAEFDLEAFEKVTFTEMGDFANQPADMKTEKTSVAFTRDGGIYKNGVKHSINIRKAFKPVKNSLNFEIDIKNKLDICYVMELNFHLNNMSEATINEIPVSEGSFGKSEKFTLKDTNTPKCVKINFNSSVEMFAYTTKTLSQSESGADLTDQGICILVPFEMNGGINIKGSIELL